MTRTERGKHKGLTIAGFKQPPFVFLANYTYLLIEGIVRFIKEVFYEYY